MTPAEYKAARALRGSHDRIVPDESTNETTKNTLK